MPCSGRDGERHGHSSECDDLQAALGLLHQNARAAPEAAVGAACAASSAPTLQTERLAVENQNVANNDQTRPDSAAETREYEAPRASDTFADKFRSQHQ